MSRVLHTSKKMASFGIGADCFEAVSEKDFIIVQFFTRKSEDYERI